MSRGRRIARVPFYKEAPKLHPSLLTVWESKDLHSSISTFPKITSETFFNNKNKLLNIEIGCGTGEFLTSIAIKFPDQNFIGIDVSRRPIFFAAHAASEKSISNLHFLRADFMLISPLFKEKSVSNFFIHFPDPNYGGYAKAKKKIITKDFLDFLYRNMMNNGNLSFVTDQFQISSEIRGLFIADKRFAISKTDQSKSFSELKKSRFHLAWEEKNRKVHNLLIEKIHSIET